MKTPFRVSDHIYLRPYGRDDLPLIVEWVNDVDVTRYILMHRPMTTEAEAAVLDSFEKSPDTVVVGIAKKEDDTLIGLTGLHKIDARHRHALFGILIGDKREWSKGYGTEATRLMVEYALLTLNLNRVYLEVLATNPRAIRSYEKLGFAHEGIFREHHYVDGRYVDVAYMAITRADWDRKRSAKST